ncbi:MAG TPA: ABC transporter ATP-binding protein [Candidatus Saccharimonadales bacterium]|nr:ABC transporter ATP-binding protein [Candidatus Saccharimonadales bacterium]
MWTEDKFLFLAYFISSFLGAILLYIVYFVYKIMIDQVTRGVHTAPSAIFLLIISTYLFFEYLSRFVNFTFNQYYFDYFMRAKLQDALTRIFMDKLASMDFAHLEDGQIRNLIAKVENTYAVRLPEIIHTLNAIVYNVAALIFSLFIALQFSPVYFMILALVSAPVYYLRSKFGNIAWSKYSAHASNANYLWYLRSLFTNFQTLSEMKIYSLREYFLNKTKILQKRLLSDYQKPITVYTILSTISFILIPVAIYFALIQFIGGVARGIHTIGDFTFFLNTLFTFSGQISSFLINLGAISENSLFVNDFFTLMDVKNSITSPKNAYMFPKILPRTIEFRHVSFRYSEADNDSLHDINFVIHKGEDVAIVGHNGAGKSTLIKLLFRFYDPTDGKILIDGKDLKEIDLMQWYQHIGVLFQDFARYFVTLEENIQFGNIAKRSRKMAHKSLYRAQGADLFRALPEGFEQILGRWFEHGIELSGGQWQKVAISRAIYRNAPILIMDEPTSAIDADAEYEIFKNLTRIYKKKNLIFISHRFSTVRMAHRIFVLEKGELVEEGTHEELLKKQGLYKKFFTMQKKGYR